MRRRGFTLVELLITMLVMSTLATAFVSLAAPQFNLFFFLPQRQAVQAVSAELMDAIFEGDAAASGLRYAEPASSTTAITEATSTALTYRYQDIGGTAHTVRLLYDGGTGRLTRQIDGGAASALPMHAGSGSRMFVEPAETDLFRYFNAAGTAFTPSAGTLGDIRRVDVAVVVRTGTGAVTDSEGRMVLKSGVDIKSLPV